MSLAHQVRTVAEDLEPHLGRWPHLVPILRRSLDLAADQIERIVQDAQDDRPIRDPDWQIDQIVHWLDLAEDARRGGHRLLTARGRHRAAQDGAQQAQTPEREC